MPAPRLIPVLLISAAAAAGCDKPPTGAAPGSAAGSSQQPAPDGGRAVAPEDGADAGRKPAALRPELREAFQLIEAHKSGPARIRLRKQLDLRPGDGQAEFLFGLSYHREKRYALALPWYEKALADDPGYFTTQYFLGWCLYYLGEPERARLAFEAHIESQPGEADSHFGLGLIDLDEDRLDDAASRFRRAIEIEAAGANRPKEVSKAYARLADVSIRRGEWTDARAHLELATTLFPDHYEAFYKLSRVLERLGETEAAEAARRAFDAARERVHPGTAFPE